MKIRTALLASLLTLLVPPVLWANTLHLQGPVDSGDEREARRAALWHFTNGLYAQNLGETDRALVEYQQASRFDPVSPAIHAQLAYHYYVSGLDYKTIEELQKSLELNPGDQDTRLLLAGLLAKQGKSAQARREYFKVLERDPKNTDARYYLAGVYVGENDNEHAIEQYREILRIAPKDSWAYYAWYNLGLIYTRQNQHQKAEEALRAAIVLNPALEAAYLSLGLILEWEKKPQEAEQVYLDLRKQDPGNAQAAMSLGKLHYDAREDAKALAEFQGYLKEHPEDPSAREYVGLVSYRLQDYDTAVEAFAGLVKDQPRSAVNRYRLASALEGTGSVGQAAEELKTVAAQNPREEDAWVRLALLYQRSHQPEEVRRTLEAGLTALPDNPDLLTLRAVADLDDGKYKEAAAQLRRVTAKDPKNAQAFFYLGVTLDKAGSFDEAMGTLKKAAELDPQNPEPRNYVGYSYAERGVKLPEAEKLIRQALALDPDNPYYQDSLAWALFKQGKNTEALALQERSVGALKETKKDDAVMFEHLGDIRKALGDTEGSGTAWKKAVEIDPTLASVRKKLGLGDYVAPAPTQTPVPAVPKKKSRMKKKNSLKALPPPVSK